MSHEKCKSFVQRTRTKASVSPKCYKALLHWLHAIAYCLSFFFCCNLSFSITPWVKALACTLAC